MGIVYLLQPQEYLKTKIYKIGMSSKDNLDSPRSHGNDSIIYLIMNCKDAFNTDIKIRRSFRKTFKLYQGTKFFKGDINKMMKTFVNIVMKHGFKSKKGKNNESEVESDVESEVESEAESEAESEVESDVESEKSVSEYEPGSDSESESDGDSEDDSFIVDDDLSESENYEEDDEKKEDILESEEESASNSKNDDYEDDDMVDTDESNFNQNIKPSQRPILKSPYDSEPKKRKEDLMKIRLIKIFIKMIIIISKKRIFL